MQTIIFRNESGDVIFTHTNAAPTTDGIVDTGVIAMQNAGIDVNLMWSYDIAPATIGEQTMQIKTIDSSSLEWEIFPNEGGVIYCADGDGFVTLEETINELDGTPWWTLCDQGGPVGEIGVNEPKTLAEALEFAQNYMAAEYSEIFEAMRFD